MERMQAEAEALKAEGIVGVQLQRAQPRLGQPRDRVLRGRHGDRPLRRASARSSRRRRCSTSPSVRVLSAAELRAALPWPVAIAAVERAFRDEDPAATPPRSHLSVPGGELLLMPAHGAAGLGVKLVTLAPGNPGRGLPFIHGAYVLFSADGLEPEALLDGTELTAIRAAAVSRARDGPARATRRALACRVRGGDPGARARRGDACGSAVASVTIVGRDPANARALAQELGAEVAGPEAVAGTNLVCACTTSAEPLFDGALLSPGPHMNAIGASRTNLRGARAGVAMRRATMVDRDARLGARRRPAT